MEPVYIPNLKIMISSWNVLSEVLYFIIKSSSLLVFYKKANFIQKKQVIFSVLIFLPTQSILNYSVFCMLIFCMNQCRCSLSAERSHHIELLTVVICATKIRNLKPDLRKKLFCMFSIWHLIKLWQIFALLVVFSVSLSEQVLRPIHGLPCAIVYKAVSNSDRLSVLFG